MRTFHLIFVGLFFSFCFANAQNKAAEQDKEILNPNFDQKLADSLGADDYGMKSYILVILKTGPKDKELTDPVQRAELFKGHFANINALADSGKLVIAGPFSTANTRKYRGIFLLNCKTEEEAKELLKGDPTLSEGIFEAEILPWYGSAAIGTHLKIHKKIAKQNP
ncbi:YciI family protein [Chryseobacterium sp. A301]